MRRNSSTPFGSWLPTVPSTPAAAVMRFELGFADAGAFRFSTDGADDWYTVVVGVEDSTRVHYRQTGSGTVGLPEAWQRLKTVAAEDLRTLTAVARTLNWDDLTVDGVSMTSRELAERMGANLETFDQVWELVHTADGEEDRHLAHEVLAMDSSWAARSVATLVLGNFLDDDTSWHALVASLIDPLAPASSVAMAMLDGPTTHESPVDWSQARSHLSAIFGERIRLLSEVC